MGRVFGIDLTIDQSWIFIAVLMTWSLTAGFRQWHPAWEFGTSLGTAVVAVVFFFVSVLLHELAHSLVARSFGIPVSRITLFLFGGVSNIEREPPSPRAEFLTAVVGPLTSLAIGFLLVAVASIATRLPPNAMVDPYGAIEHLSPGATLLLWLGPINVVVGLFNLVPCFPLDGGRIFRSAVWGVTKDLHRATQMASGLGQAIGWLFIFLGLAEAFGVSVPFFGRGLVAGIWLAFIGWFLTNAAAQTWRRQLVHEVLEGMTVARLMRPPPAVVPATASVEALVHDWLMQNEERAFPVVDGATFVGLVTLSDVRKPPRGEWPRMPVTDVMTPRSLLVATSPGEELASALEKLAGADVSQLPVLEGDRLAGILRRSDVARWLELHVSPRTPSASWARHAH